MTVIKVYHQEGGIDWFDLYLTQVGSVLFVKSCFEVEVTGPVFCMQYVRLEVPCLPLSPCSTSYSDGLPLGGQGTVTKSVLTGFQFIYLLISIDGIIVS